MKRFIQIDWNTDQASIWLSLPAERRRCIFAVLRVWSINNCWDVFKCPYIRANVFKVAQNSFLISVFLINMSFNIRLIGKKVGKLRDVLISVFLITVLNCIPYILYIGDNIPRKRGCFVNVIGTYRTTCCNRPLKILDTLVD